jgi:uncharacterized protein YdhG (YjbR/CyaY superfamily)
MKPKTNSKTIDEYIDLQEPRVRSVLERVRKTISQAAPNATETISYAMPTFKYYGYLVHFAVFKNHLGFYPSPDGIVAFEEELKDYKTSKGAIQFLLHKPIPYELITNITKFRVKQNFDRAKKI